jgi:hypothetical protein
MSGQIFISYRREESRWSAGRLYDRLCAHFDRKQVFRDIDAIALGEDFRGYGAVVIYEKADGKRDCTDSLGAASEQAAIGDALRKAKAEHPRPSPLALARRLRIIQMAS